MPHLMKKKKQLYALIIRKEKKTPITKETSRKKIK
jgi:hypothetical protein